jgi:hypothetical protein
MITTKKEAHMTRTAISYVSEPVYTEGAKAGQKTGEEPRMLHRLDAGCFNWHPGTRAGELIEATPEQMRTLPQCRKCAKRHS